MDAIPLPLFFVGVIAVIVISVEVGFALGKYAVQRSPDEKESPAAAVGGAVLGLVAFLLAFTFSIASGRFDARKELVRDDAEAIRTAWLRADFLPEAEQRDVKRLLDEYLDLRISLAESKDMSKLPEAQVKTLAIQKRLWAYVVANGKKDSSDISAMVAESINDVINIHARRITIAIDARIPLGIWISLGVLSVLGMVATGYQMGVAAPKRSRTGALLAIAFALVMTLILGLDRPNISFVPVSQKPLRDVKALMDQPPEPVPGERP